ncbi:hypothetical protein ACHAXA_011386 [Cyclostephanos tholiformis]|uniref:CFA20 domain-containing protein n=1 Tax=Cyclostephanos tholiformis TaxID=382380 RepID=A0ABD3RAH6_9STRA
MFRNTFQSGFLSILYSIGSKPLQIWDSKVKNGHIKRITDQDIQSSVLEIMGTNVSTSYIVCPADPQETLGIKLPFLVMIIKNLNKYFTFEVQVLDDKGVKRRFRASNYQSTTRVKPFICTMPMRLDEGWNQIQFNLSDFTRRAYGTNYVETVRVQIHANCRIRRIYFSDRLYSEEELPPEFKLFIPTTPAPRGDKVVAVNHNKFPLKVEEKVEVLALDEAEIGETEIGETEIGEPEISEHKMGKIEIDETEIGEAKIVGIATVLTESDNGEKSLDSSRGDIAVLS